MAKLGQVGMQILQFIGRKLCLCNIKWFYVKCRDDHNHLMGCTEIQFLEYILGADISSKIAETTNKYALHKSRLSTLDGKILWRVCTYFFLNNTVIIMFIIKIQNLVKYSTRRNISFWNDSLWPFSYHVRDILVWSIGPSG